MLENSTNSTRRFDDGLRSYSRADRLIGRVDEMLRQAAFPEHRDSIPSPGDELPDPPLATRDRRHAGGLMRVNHTGEVCAQALYLGQAAVARDPALAESLRAAAAEEADHLAWCDQRLSQLGERRSVLNPFWFGASAVIGAGAALIGDKWSLGFVEETEKQVVKHLEGHLDELPPADLRSRAIVSAMRADEARHAAQARERGAAPLPKFVTRLMTLQAKVMTTVAYWL
jgi:ubiquinone biosynthesis monooxygenase Coq7